MTHTSLGIHRAKCNCMEDGRADQLGVGGVGGRVVLRVRRAQRSELARLGGVRVPNRRQLLRDFAESLIQFEAPRLVFEAHRLVCEAHRLVFKAHRLGGEEERRTRVRAPARRVAARSLSFMRRSVRASRASFCRSASSCRSAR